MMKSLSTTLVALAIGASCVAYANANDAHHATPAADKAGTSGTLADGEIRKVDKRAGKLTIKHGPIQSLNMPNMTMVFRVKDRSMLDQVKTGDKVKFDADRIDGNYTVTKLEAAN